MPKIYFEAPGVCLTFNPENGEVSTDYPGQRWSRVRPDRTDQEHAEALGITAKQHKLAHEAAHHLIAFHHGYPSSPIIWRSAHHTWHPEQEADEEERGVYALVYYTFARPRDYDLPSLHSFAMAGVSVDAMADQLRSILMLARIAAGRPRTYPFPGAPSIGSA